MPFDLLANLTMHLTESPLPSPITLAGLVEASFPGYLAQPLSAVVMTRVETGLTALNCSCTFFNNGITGSANPSAAFLVSETQGGPQLVSVCKLNLSQAPPINHGGFRINCNFVFSSND